jgi:hypothetical protein
MQLAIRIPPTNTMLIGFDPHGAGLRLRRPNDAAGNRAFSLQWVERLVVIIR